MLLPPPSSTLFPYTTLFRSQQQQVGEWTNTELNQLSEFLETSTDRPARKKAFRRMLEIAEREDPAYTVLHQNATFTADRKSTRLNSSHSSISYAVFCLKKKK